MTPADHIEMGKAALAYAGAFLIIVYAIGAGLSFWDEHKGKR